MIPKALSSLGAACAGGVLVVAACGGGATQTTRPVAAPAATVAATPAATPAAASTPAATYTVTAGAAGTTVLHAPNFDVPLSLTFGADWSISAVDKGLLDLMWGGVDMGIQSMAMVTLPGATPADPYIPFPADFVAWLGQRPEFVPSAPRTVTIAGRTGTLVDADFVWKDGTAKSEFLRYGSGGWLYDEYDAGNRVRFIVLPGPSGVGGLVVVMNARIAEFEGAATSLDALLATIQFDAPIAYRTKSFEVPLVLMGVAGWTTGAETAANLELRHSDLDLDPGIESIASLRAPSAPGRAAEPWPKDFRSWLANQPEFTPGSPADVTVGGRPGTQVDVDVSLSATDAPRIVLEGEGFDWKTVATPERWRFIVVETGPGAGIVIVLATAPEKFNAAAAALDQLLGTLAFR